MQQTTKEKRVKVTQRFSTNIFKQLERAASEAKRSLSAEVEYRIEQSFTKTSRQ